MKKLTLKLEDEYITHLDTIASKIVRGGTSKTQAIRIMIEDEYNRLNGRKDEVRQD